jgi:hypothetical protein
VSIDMWWSLGLSSSRDAGRGIRKVSVWPLPNVRGTIQSVEAFVGAIETKWINGGEVHRRSHVLEHGIISNKFLDTLLVGLHRFLVALASAPTKGMNPSRKVLNSGTAQHCGYRFGRQLRSRT